MNVDLLEKMADPEGKVDLGRAKVLGRGRLTRKLNVNASAFSAAARNKIEAAGGQAVVV